MFLNKGPDHEHVYSNGHICLNILYSDWSPALTINSIAVSLQSMLASAQVKCRPEDDDRYVAKGTKDPRKTSWWFHDDKC